MMLDASVIICTHNPRPEYLARVLNALRNQSLPRDRWELLIVDNASSERLSFAWDISWHPNGRHIFESELGLASARRRGMEEASSELLVFVDDDNVVDVTYVAEALRISRDWPALGVWGSGSIALDFEVEPPDYLRKFLPSLALRETPIARWSNLTSCREAMPWGAGLCVRAMVGVAYRRWCEQSLIQITDRKGTKLHAGGDEEICYSACRQGLGMGIFPELGVIHLIPKERISEEYLIRLAEGAATTRLLLEYKWNGVMPRSPLSPRLLLSAARSVIMHDRADRKLHFAEIRASTKARRIIGSNHDHHGQGRQRVPAMHHPGAGMGHGQPGCGSRVPPDERGLTQGLDTRMPARLWAAMTDDAAPGDNESEKRQ